MPFRPALQVRFRRPTPGTRAQIDIANGGDGETRTHNLLFTKQPLYQLELHRRFRVWTGREADAPLRTPLSRQSPFCRNESRPDMRCALCFGFVCSPACRTALSEHIRKRTKYQALSTKHLPVPCGAQGRTQTFNLWFVEPALHQLSYSGMNWWSELESNQPFGFFRPALIHLSYPTVGLLAGLEPAASTFEASHSSS